MGELWKVWLFILAVLSSGNCLKATKLLPESGPVESSLVKCLLMILGEPTLDFMVNIGIHIDTESIIFRRQFINTVEKFMALNDKVAIQLDTDGSVSYDNHGHFYFIDSLDSLRLLIDCQREQDKNFSGERQYYLIVLPLNVPKLGDILDKIFRFCWKSFIINVNILVEDQNGVVTLYTYFPFTADRCGDTTPTIHNRFINGRFEFNKPTFPRKTSNLWQCPVSVIAYESPPYVVLNQDHLTGFEVNVFQSLAEVVNFSLDIVISPDGGGEIFSNGNLEGDYKMLNDGLGEFLIAACSKMGHTTFAATNPFHVSAIRFVVKRPKPYSPLEILLFPFDWFTWGALLIVFTGKWIGQLLWKRTANMTIHRREYSTKFYITLWLFCILVLRSSYEGSIFKFLHNKPSRSPPNSLHEAIDQGYKFIVSPSVYDYLNHLPVLANKMIKFGDSELEAFEFFDALVDKYGYINWNEYLSLYIDSDSSQKYFIAQEPVLVNAVCIYLRKFSYLTVELNKRVGQIVENGHIPKLYKEAKPKNLFQKSKADTKPKRMSLQKLLGAFQLLLMLAGFSACVFGMELLSRHNEKLKIILNFFQ